MVEIRIGYMIKNTIMSTGILLGGIAFLISLVFMVLEFGKECRLVEINS
jgi:hypothetical protein